MSRASTEPLEALRYGMFNTISMATTTGYANTDFAQWPLFAPLTMLLLSGFATSAGSTGGGIKMIRGHPAGQTGAQRTRNNVASSRGQSGPDQRPWRSTTAMSSVLAFMLFYGLSIAVFTSLLLLSGLDPITAFSAVFASVNNTGPGWGPSAPG